MTLEIAIFNLIPLLAIVGAVVLVVKAFIKKEIAHKNTELRSKSVETILPLRLQAYERICLLLERISLKNLILRVNTEGLSASEFQSLLTTEIRQEFNHNISQQIYMGHGTWEEVKKAIEDTIGLINLSAQNLKEGESSIVLAKTLFQAIMTQDTELTTAALISVKNEVKQLFNG